MERYLVYDAQCTTCNRLAVRIQEAVSDRLRAMDIKGDEARTLLDRARPGGWVDNPYLVTVSRRQVRAWTGTGAAVRLGVLMGPRKAFRVWSLPHRSGVPLPPGSRAAAAYDVSRRQFLKVGMVLASVGGRWAFPSFDRPHLPSHSATHRVLARSADAVGEGACPVAVAITSITAARSIAAILRQLNVTARTATTSAAIRLAFCSSSPIAGAQGDRPSHSRRGRKEESNGQRQSWAC
jgi:predicted DCC family thiol-disulfide oxidoreductase YuxK